MRIIQCVPQPTSAPAIDKTAMASNRNESTATNSELDFDDLETDGKVVKNDKGDHHVLGTAPGGSSSSHLVLMRLARKAWFARDRQQQRKLNIGTPKRTPKPKRACFRPSVVKFLGAMFGRTLARRRSENKVWDGTGYKQVTLKPKISVV